MLSPLNANPDKAMRAADKLENIINRYIHEMSQDEIAHAYFLLGNAVAAMLSSPEAYRHAEHVLIDYLGTILGLRTRAKIIMNLYPPQI